MERLFDQRKPRRQDAWDAANMRPVSTHLKTEEALELLAACMAEGITRYALMQQLLRDWLRARK